MWIVAALSIVYTTTVISIYARRFFTLKQRQSGYTITVAGYVTIERAARAVTIGPATMEADLRFVNPPRSGAWVALRTGGLLEQGEKTLPPAVHCPSINHEAAFSEPLHDVGIAEPVAHIPPHGHGDHLIRDPHPVVVPRAHTVHLA